MSSNKFAVIGLTLHDFSTATFTPDQQSLQQIEKPRQVTLQKKLQMNYCKNVS